MKGDVDMAFLDGNGVLYLWQKIVNKFVAKESGKGLSSNDFTTNEKTKLSGIATGANKTVVENVLTSTSTTNALAANQGKALDEKITALRNSMGSLGYGDMLKSVYDTNDDGKVNSADNSDKLGGQLPSYYAKASDVPTKLSELDGDATHRVVTDTEKAAWNSKAAGTHQHAQSDINGLSDTIAEITEIAEGKCQTFVFATVDELTAWLANDENTKDLKVGDVFLVKAVDVPDYWWDGTTKQILETTKVDLTAITNAEIDKIVGDSTEEPDADS